MTIVQKIMKILKEETVLAIASLLAVISMFLIKPNVGYVEYIDFRVLGILFCLMIVMAKFQELGIFSLIAYRLLKKTGNTRQLVFVLVFLCFFSSMIITNDVALLTFVPFGILTLKQAKREDLLLKVVVLQTIAANLGSMLTPIGNPQNLYLYNLAGISLVEFLRLMLPYTLLSLAVLTGVIFFMKKETMEQQGFASVHKEEKVGGSKFYIHTLIYFLLFVISLLTVAHILPYQLVVVVVGVVVIFTDCKMFKKVDYSLLFTFIAFFIFVGNMQMLPAVKEWLLRLVDGRELLMAVLSSQVISNVPAAFLLSGFTDKYDLLIVGTNLGGLGTLIASMASLISYKFYVKEYPEKKGGYFWHFTIMNLFFIIVLVGAEVLVL